MCVCVCVCVCVTTFTHTYIHQSFSREFMCEGDSLPYSCNRLKFKVFLLLDRLPC